MKLLCLLFGCRSCATEYGQAYRCGIDGIGREHAYVKARCIRCDRWFVVSCIHMPRRKKK